MNTDKFSCSCCGRGYVDSRLITLLQALEKLVATYIPNYRMAINSGYRCPKHNAEVGGKSNSAHTDRPGFVFLSNAVDINCPDDHLRLFLIGLGFSLGLRRFEDRDGWVHIDNDPTKPQGVLFRE